MDTINESNGCLVKEFGVCHDIQGENGLRERGRNEKTGLECLLCQKGRVHREGVFHGGGEPFHVDEFHHEDVLDEVGLSK